MTNEQAISRAVDYVFRLIGGGMNSPKAIAYAAEHFGVCEEAVRFEYREAIEIAAESD
jgi:hypothetical protein